MKKKHLYNYNMELIANLAINIHKYQYDNKLDTDLSYYTFNLIAKLNEVNRKEAITYYKQARLSDKKLRQIQTACVRELNQLYPMCYIIPSSSFTAKCNVPSDSDIDIYIYYKKPIDTSMLASLNYTNKPSPVTAYSLYGKTVNNIPIEVKVRNYSEGTRMRKLHEYLDKKLTTLERINCTYIKHKLTNDKPAYKAFKYLLFNYCLYNLGDKKLL